MAKHPTSSRVHRDDSHTDDAFVRAVKGLGTWAARNARAITLFAVGIAIIAAARLEAAAFENLGQADNAVTEYRRIADNARFSYQRREALADAARVRMQTGDPQAAIPLYEQILATFKPDEPGRQYYVMWLAEARAQAHGAPAAPDTSTDSATAGS